MTRHFLTAFALAGLAVALAACSAPAPRPTATPAPPPVSASVGDDLRADGWILSVDAVTFDATVAVAAANEFNPVPDDDEQYALVTMTVTRTATPTTGIDIDIALVIDDERYTPAAAAAPIPLHLLSEFATNVPTAGQVAFLVPKPADAADVQVSVTDSQTFLVGAE